MVLNFIVYKSVDSLEAAVAAEHTISNKKVAVKKAQAKQGKVYIGKLPAEVSDDEIKNHMATFGTIANIEQPFDKIKNERKNFCFITYESENVAKQLLKEGTVYISGNELEVKKVTPKPQYPGGMDPNMGYMMGGGGRGGYQGGGGQWGGGYGGDASGYGGWGGYGGGYDQGYGGGGYGGYGGYPAGGAGGKAPRGMPGGMRGGFQMRGGRGGGDRGGRGGPRGKPY